MTELGKYDLMETIYNNLVSGGMSDVDAWTEILNNYKLYEYKNDIDSPQDAQLLNIRAINQQWMLRKNDEMMRKYATAMSVVL